MASIDELIKQGQVPVIDELGNLKTIAPTDVQAWQDQGGSIATPEDVANWKEQKQYGDHPLKAGALGAGAGVSFGLIPKALDKTGIISGEEQEKYKKHNEGAYLTGELVGSVAPLIAAPEIEGLEALNAAREAGTVAKEASTLGKVVRGVGVLPRGVAATGRAVEGGVGKLLAPALTSESTIARAVAKAAAKGIGSAVEGAAYGAGQAINEDTLGERDLTAENLLADLGYGALFGGSIPIGAELLAAGGRKLNALPKGLLGGKTITEKLGQYTQFEDMANETALKALGPKLVDTKRAMKAGEDAMEEYAEAIRSPHVVGRTYDEAGQITSEETQRLFSGLTSKKEMLERAKAIKNQAGEDISESLGVLNYEGNEIGRAERKQFSRLIEEAKQQRDAQLQLLNAQKAEIEQKVGVLGANKKGGKGLGGTNTEFHYGHGVGAQKKLAALEDEIKGTHETFNARVADLELQKAKTRVQFDGPKVATLLRRELEEPALNTPVFAKDKAKIEKLVSEMANTKNLSLLQANNFKQRLQTEAQREYDAVSGRYSLAGEIRLASADLVRKEIINVAEQIAAKGSDSNKLWKAVQRLNEGNRLYSHMSRAERTIESAVASDATNRNFSLTDQMLGGLAGAVGGITSGGTGLLVGGLGTAVVNRAARTYGNQLQSLLFERLADIEKRSMKTMKRINKLSSDVFSKSKHIAVPVSTKIFHEVRFSPDAKKRKDDTQAFYDRVDEVKALAENPERALDQLTATTGHLNDAAPNITDQLNLTALNGIQFLASKAPKISEDFFGKRITPSRSEMLKFARYVRAVNDPMTVLEDLAAGQLSREGVEVLRTLYPSMYQAVQAQMLDHLSELRQGLKYEQRTQLTLLLGVPIDPSNRPEVLRSIQAMYQTQTQQKQQQGGSGSSSQIAQLYQTQAQKNEGA